MTYHIIGTVYKATGTMLVDEEGFEYPEQVAVDGYHVNVLGGDEELNAYTVKPSSPSCVFAGRMDTRCLKFTDRDEWLALGIETIEEQIDVV